jgi:hypothetical protein
VVIIACTIDLDLIPTDQYATVLAYLGEPDRTLTKWTYNGGDSHTYTAVRFHPQSDGSYVRVEETAGIGDFTESDWHYCQGLDRAEWENYLATERAA